MPPGDTPQGIPARVTRLEAELETLRQRIDDLERLDVACPVCEGTRFAPSNADGAPCWRCAGVGTIPTAHGERMLRLTQTPRDPD